MSRTTAGRPIGELSRSSCARTRSAASSKRCKPAIANPKSTSTLSEDLGQDHGQTIPSVFCLLLWVKVEISTPFAVLPRAEFQTFAVELSDDDQPSPQVQPQRPYSSSKPYTVD